MRKRICYLVLFLGSALLLATPLVACCQPEQQFPSTVEELRRTKEGGQADEARQVEEQELSGLYEELMGFIECARAAAADLEDLDWESLSSFDLEFEDWELPDELDLDEFPVPSGMLPSEETLELLVEACDECLALAAKAWAQSPYKELQPSAQDIQEWRESCAELSSALSHARDVASALEPGISQLLVDLEDSPDSGQVEEYSDLVAEMIDCLDQAVRAASELRDWPFSSLATDAEAAAPAAPAEEGELSFEAAEYRNTQYGFSIKYPKDWAQADVGGVFSAEASGQVPALTVDVRDVEAGATFADVLTAVLEAEGGSGVEIISEKETTLADGATPASEAAVKFKIRGVTAHAFSLGAIKDSKWIIVTITTVKMFASYDEALFSEIAYTLQFE